MSQEPKASLKQEDIVGLTIDDLLPPDVPPAFKDMDQTVLIHRGTQTYQTRLKPSNGEQKETMFSKASFSDSEQAAAGVAEVKMGLAELAEAKRALEESEAFNRTLFAQLPVGLALCRMDGRFVEVNPAFARILGRSVEEAKTLRFWDMTPEEHMEADRRLMTQLEQTGRYGPLEKTYVRPDGQRVPVRLQGLLVERDGERLIWSNVEDITARVEGERQREMLESQLRQAQKLEAIGALAGGIAHDFNNILTSVIGYGELALLQGTESSVMRDYVHEILRAGTRAKELVRQILAFGRQGEQEIKPVQVKLIVNEALKLLRPSLPSTIEIRRQIQSDACVMADSTQLHQILMNLCTNAEHAMRAGGGILEIGLREVTLDPEEGSLSLSRMTDRYLLLSVADTGCGMKPSVKERIFDPFFTTKKKEEGTGLGLAVVHGIVQACGGRIEVDSNPGRGTSFRIYLPVAEQLATSKSEELTPAANAAQAHVLLVDDEPPVVRMIARNREWGLR